MEIWKEIKNADYYLISNRGNVKRAEHKRWNSINKSFSVYKERRLLPSTNNSKGYKRIQIFYKKQKRTVSVHRLVAEAFIDNPLNKPQINHIDHNKLNNNVNNLEWCTNSENMTHSLSQRNWDHVKGEKCNLSKLKKEEVLQIPVLLKSGLTNLQIAKKYNVSPSTISEIRNKRSWKHLKLFND